MYDWNQVFDTTNKVWLNLFYLEGRCVHIMGCILVSCNGFIEFFSYLTSIFLSNVYFLFIYCISCTNTYEAKGGFFYEQHWRR